MAKYVCSVCGYVHEGDSAPDVCPICKAPAEKFQKQEGERLLLKRLNMLLNLQSCLAKL